MIRYDPSNRTILIGDLNVLNYQYEVDPERMLSSEAMLDWIMQVGTKREDWISDADIGALVRWLGVVIGPQQTLCGFGMCGSRGRTLTKAAIRQALDSMAESAP